MSRTWKRIVGTSSAAVLVIGAGAGIAAADNVSNSLDNTVDATAETMPLNVGGGNGSTTLTVIPTNGDGKNGCNLTGSTTLGISLSSSDPSVATVSPTSITFSSCGDVKVVTVTPVAVGSATISASQTSNTTGGSFDLNPVKFTVTVSAPAPANTAPQISISGVDAGASYAKGSVPPATCDVTDAEDGPSSFPATLSDITGPYASDGIGSQTASCSYTDAGGLTASGSVTYSIIDPTPPVISYVLNPAAADGANGWYTSDVTLTWTVTEAESPNSLVLVGCDDQTITTDQQSTDYSCSASSAGGESGPTVVSVKRDATAPTVSLVDAPSGDYYFGSVPPAPICTASDATSGLAGDCVVSGGGTSVGDHSYTASAVDNAGNTASTTTNYTVLPWNLSGFYSPVDMGSVWNTVKGGSTVPFKFEVFAGTELTSTSVVQSFTAQQVSCPGGSAITDAIEITTTGGTSLRYDTTAGQFVQNWATPKKPGTCYAVTMTTQDGSSLTARFALK